VDELPPSIPKGAYLVRISRHFKPIGHGKRKLQFVDGLLGLVQGVYGKSYDIHILRFEFLNMGLEIGQLPIAVRSPATAVKDENGILTCEILREIKRPAISGLDFIFWKKIANV